MNESAKRDFVVRRIEDLSAVADRLHARARRMSLPELRSGILQARLAESEALDYCWRCADEVDLWDLRDAFSELLERFGALKERLGQLVAVAVTPEYEAMADYLLERMSRGWSRTRD
jgi:hypothetical protein